MAEARRGRRASVGRRLGATVATMMLAAVLVAATVGVAGAQSIKTSGFTCSFSVDRTSLPAGGGPVTVTGTAPGSSVVRVFVDGVLAATTTSAPVTGTFSVEVILTRSGEVTAALDGYPNTPCLGVGGETVERPRTVAATSRLAFTGANGTRPFVLIGLVALSLGIVLVVAARRRNRVQGRA